MDKNPSSHRLPSHKFLRCSGSRELNLLWTTEQPCTIQEQGDRRTKESRYKQSRVPASATILLEQTSVGFSFSLGHYFKTTSYPTPTSHIQISARILAALATLSHFNAIAVETQSSCTAGEVPKTTELLETGALSSSKQALTTCKSIMRLPVRT